MASWKLENMQNFGLIKGLEVQGIIHMAVDKVLSWNY